MIWNNHFNSTEFKILQIDWDKFRSNKKYKNSFSKKNVIENNLKIIEHIKNKHKIYDYIIVSVVSPILKTRIFARSIFGSNYYEIYVKCKVSTLLKRDTKGLYKLAKTGKIKNLIGYKSKIYYEYAKKNFYKQIQEILKKI